MECFQPKQLFEELIQLDECPRIEAKRATEIGSSIMQTICAFANEPGLGGGWILLGISEPDSAHDSYWVSGVSGVDKLLGELQNNCRNQFEQPLTIHAQHEKIDGKLVVSVFVPELEPAAKPCRFLGKPGKPNKRKTGVWRRGANGDYECTERELEPILMARTGSNYEQIIFSGVEWDDLDPNMITLYRKLRAHVKPNAAELQVDDVGMLHSLHLIKKQQENYLPNLAGLVLLGKSLSLRRLLPVARVDYVRIQGTEWVENPDQRFSTTLDLREPLIQLITKLESAILDDMPYHFRLEEGETQRSDHPLLPQRVIREAVVNALMHRDYQVNQPILVVRYRNRLEIQNPGYSLKPVTELGEMGSKLRNPIIASVLYDLSFAETKGSGICSMQALLEQAGLTKPMFVSNRESNQFTAIFLLHQLLGEEQLQWLEQFKHLHLSADEAKALVLVKETRAIDNAALRAVTDLDTLAASQVLRRLWQQHHLIEKGGKGPASYYVPSNALQMTLIGSQSLSNRGDLESNRGDLESNRGDLESNRGDLESNRGDLEPNRGDLPDSLQQAIRALTPKARKSKLWPIILQLCLQSAYSAEEIAAILGKNVKALKAQHLTPMRKKGLLHYLHAEVINHPAQAYKTSKEGKEWLEKNRGI
jgi:ATP-dependent DNA helicase RecG